MDANTIKVSTNINATLPVARTMVAIHTSNSVTLRGDVKAGWLPTTVTFEYGFSPAYGNTVSIPNNPITGDTLEVVYLELTDLLPSSVYFYRIVAVNSLGSSEGIGLILVTGANSGVLQDIDDNQYSTFRYNNREWIIENLKTTKYANGDSISNITESNLWGQDTTGAYCWYENNISNKSVYGALYNWYAVSNAKNLVYFKRNGVYEAGWRVPTESDYASLASQLGGTLNAGGELKEVGFTHWRYPNTNATNSIGFKGLPSGSRDQFGTFNWITSWMFIWSSTSLSTLTASCLAAGYNLISCVVGGATQKSVGYAVRCVRNV